MSPSSIRLARVSVLSIIIVSGFVVSQWISGDVHGEAAGPVVPGSTNVLGLLDLAHDQWERIEQVRERERAWLEQLRCALERSERDLRSAETELPFDAKRINDLVVSEAELIAYLRGTESRMIAAIARLMTPDQKRRFSEIRGDSPSDLLSSIEPAPDACRGTEQDTYATGDGVRLWVIAGADRSASTVLPPEEY